MASAGKMVADPFSLHECINLTQEFLLLYSARHFCLNTINSRAGILDLSVSSLKLILRYPQLPNFPF